MRIEWDTTKDVDVACRETLGFVVCDGHYDIQKIYRGGLFHESSLEWWTVIDNIAMCCPGGQSEEDKYVQIFIIDAVAQCVTGLPGVRVGKFYLRNLNKVDAKFAQAVKVAVVLSMTLNPKKCVAPKEHSTAGKSNSNDWWSSPQYTPWNGQRKTF